MKEFGDSLKKARIDAGLSIDDIHEQTRISKKNLRLIEDGNFPSIPQTYVRAFIREYAGLVGLDENDIIQQYNEAAEREKGIPLPPQSFDSGNILPKVDDTIESIDILDTSPSHVEVDGTPEVKDQKFTQNVKRSPFVGKDHTPPIDIRTTRRDDAATEKRSPIEPDDTPEIKSRVEKPVTDSPAAATPGVSGSGKEAEQKRGAAPKKRIIKETQEILRRKLSLKKEHRSVFETKPPIPDENIASTQNPIKTESPSEEKRILTVGILIILIIIVCIYAIFHFSDEGIVESPAIDSTAFIASLEAGTFIDSSHSVLIEAEPTPLDTITTQPIEARAATEAIPRVFAGEDSLLLEAFTTAPVWFSLKMDTTRTERGSMSSKEHRSWKAKHYFIITLGDAGAVTFFLNGREIGALGEEGSVIKNMKLSRQNLDQ